MIRWGPPNLIVRNNLRISISITLMTSAEPLCQAGFRGLGCGHPWEALVLVLAGTWRKSPASGVRLAGEGPRLRSQHTYNACLVLAAGIVIKPVL